MSAPFAIVANCCTHTHDREPHDAPRPVREPTSRTTGASNITDDRPGSVVGDGGGRGRRAHVRPRVGALPDLPQHHGDGVRETLRVIGEARPRSTCTRSRPERRRSTGRSRASGTSATRGSRTRRASGSSTSSVQPARRGLQRAGARTHVARPSCGRTLTTIPEHPTGSRTARRTTTRPGASA